MVSKLLSVNEVSEILGLSPNYILCCSTQHPERVPKSFKINGSRRWKEIDVLSWIEKRYMGKK